MKVTVELDWNEVSLGAFVGLRRTITSLRKGRHRDVWATKVKNKDSRWQVEIEGSLAEVAVAKHLGVFWDGSVDTFKRADVGSVQVRHTELQEGCLIVRPEDADDEKYILVCGTYPIYELCGWMLGVMAKKEEFIRDPGGVKSAFFIPQKFLSDMKELKQS